MPQCRKSVSFSIKSLRQKSQLETTKKIYIYVMIPKVTRGSLHGPGNITRNAMVRGLSRL